MTSVVAGKMTAPAIKPERDLMRWESLQNGKSPENQDYPPMPKLLHSYSVFKGVSFWGLGEYLAYGYFLVF